MKVQNHGTMTTMPRIVQELYKNVITKPTEEILDNKNNRKEVKQQRKKEIRTRGVSGNQSEHDIF